MRYMGLIRIVQPDDPESEFTGSQKLMYASAGEEPLDFAHRMVDSIKAWPGNSEDRIEITITALN